MKNQIDKGLQSMYTPLKSFTYLASRNWGIKMMNFSARMFNGKKIKGLHNEERFIPSKNGGPDIRVRIFKPLNVKGRLPLLQYIHGGGYILGSPEMMPNLDIIKQFIEKRPCIVIAPAYRKALDTPYPAAFNDCYDTLLWAKENAEELGIYDDNFMVAGHSGGGGLTAAVTIKARDTGDFNIAFQMPFYPMIDDLQNTNSAKEMTSVPVWNTKSNKKGWDSYLKNIKANNEEVPAYAAAARNKDYTNFPPTISFVGDMEPFKDETIAYIDALKQENIDVKFKLYKGAYHGFDAYVPNAQISKDAVKFTYDSFGEFYDKYIKQ
ncbi:alpha/beta hydrolase [Aureibaculum sp. A20]|uniref:Alpha/beta hydrolase n=1 Tax=Aureibaculum flavum TaxID=2795986 RepID=A0ABS0WT23_9FLAO|nr:alpha/beta hydrolase [Aureibaculum flavum]MBJ2175141.1 alpha/beta hydrolase [Aureibaculum flavum]